jgi:nicotinamide-nucleotide amidase
MQENNFSLSQKLAAVLLKKNLKLAVAESCTGGGLAYQLTAVPGSSAWFERGFIVYTNEAKMELLAVKSETLLHYGAVSEQVALEMVQGVLRHSPADIALSITGIAGPQGGSLEKPVGTVWLGLGGRQIVPQAKHIFLTGGRRQIRYDSIGIIIRWLYLELTEQSHTS